jgi:hypothetical protein
MNISAINPNYINFKQNTAVQPVQTQPANIISPQEKKEKIHKYTGLAIGALVLTTAGVVGYKMGLGQPIKELFEHIFKGSKK